MVQHRGLYTESTDTSLSLRNTASDLFKDQTSALKTPEVCIGARFHPYSWHPIDGWLIGIGLVNPDQTCLHQVVDGVLCAGKRPLQRGGKLGQREKRSLALCCGAKISFKHVVRVCISNAQSRVKIHASGLDDWSLRKQGA